MEKWWVTQPGLEPVGPVTEDIVVRGIQAGKVPSDSLVCQVGGDAWKGVREIPAFADAFDAPPLERFDESSEDHTVVDVSPFDRALGDGGSARHTEPAPEPKQDEASSPRNTEPSSPRHTRPAAPPDDFDDPSEKTIADVVPRPDPDPPTIADAEEDGLSSYEDSTDQTIVDRRPPRSS